MTPPASALSSPPCDGWQRFIADGVGAGRIAAGRAAHGDARQRDRFRRLPARLPRAVGRAGRARSRQLALRRRRRARSLRRRSAGRHGDRRRRRRRRRGAAGQRAGGVPAAQRERRPAPRPRALRPALSAALALPGRARPARRSARSRLAARRRDGAGGAARHAQDEGVRALPHDRRARTTNARRAVARRLVRARASHRRGDGAVLRAPLHGHALGDPDAGAQRPLGRRAALARPGRAPRPGAACRRRREALAHLLPEHLQSGAPEARRHAEGDAQALLEEPAGSAADRTAGRRGRRTEHDHDRQRTDRSEAAPRHRAAADAGPRRDAGRRFAAQPAGAARSARALPRVPDRRARDAGGARRGPEARAL